MSTYPMISIEIATETALSHASVLDYETVSLQEARGRVLAANVLAPDNHPAFRASVKVSFALTNICLVFYNYYPLLTLTSNLDF